MLIAAAVIASCFGFFALWKAGQQNGWWRDRKTAMRASGIFVAVAAAFAVAYIVTEKESSADDNRQTCRICHFYA